MSELPLPGSGDEPDHDGSAERRVELVSDYVDRVEAEWRRYDISATTRRRLGAALDDDLRAALDAGASLEEVLDVEAATLARDIAAAEGLPHDVKAPVARPDVSLLGLIAWGLGSMVAMAGLVWSFALMPLAHVFYNEATPATLVLSLVTVYGVCAAATLAAGAVGMTHYLRHEVDARPSVVLAVALAAAAGAVGVVICVLLAGLWNYSDAPGVVLVYVAITGGLCSAGIALAWRRARPPGVRRSSRELDPSPVAPRGS